MRLSLQGRITEEGKPVLKEKERLTDFISKNKGKRFVVTFETEKKYRTSSQNSYYWGVVIQEILEGLRGVGYDVIPGSRQDAEAVHEMLKGMFVENREIVNEEGIVIELPKSTSSMSKEEFARYIDQVARWASEFLGIVISEAVN